MLLKLKLKLDSSEENSSLENDMESEQYKEIIGVA